MRLCIKGAKIFTREGLKRADVTMEEGRITAVGRIGRWDGPVLDGRGKILSPGFVDVDAEACPTLSQDAVRGGFTTVCVLPGGEARLPQEPAVRLLQYGWLSREGRGLLPADISAHRACCGFTDGAGEPASTELMRMAMTLCARAGKPVAARCRDESQLIGGCVHDGLYARINGLRGIPSESERRQLIRDLSLVRLTGCRYLMRRVSCRESLALLADAKGDRLPVFCAVPVWHTLLCDMDMADDGRFRLEPPLRGERDRSMFHRALADGLIDAVCSCHAPRTPEEKSGGLSGSLPGVPALPWVFPALYTGLVLTKILKTEQLLQLLTYGPSDALGLPCGIEPGAPADLVLLDLTAPGRISGGTPLDGMATTGAVTAVWFGGTQLL